MNQQPGFPGISLGAVDNFLKDHSTRRGNTMTITTHTTTTVTTAAGRSGTIHTNDTGQKLYRTMAWNSDHTADELRAIANLIDHQDDEVVDAEIHCSDCDVQTLELLHKHIKDRIAHRNHDIDTTLEPITMHPIHRSALYELELLDRLLTIPAPR